MVDGVEVFVVVCRVEVVGGAGGVGAIEVGEGGGRVGNFGLRCALVESDDGDVLAVQ